MFRFVSGLFSCLNVTLLTTTASSSAPPEEGLSTAAFGAASLRQYEVVLSIAAGAHYEAQLFISTVLRHLTPQGCANAQVLI